MKYTKKMRTRLVQGLAANIVVVVVKVVVAMVMDVVAGWWRLVGSQVLPLWSCGTHGERLPRPNDRLPTHVFGIGDPV